MCISKIEHAALIFVAGLYLYSVGCVFESRFSAETI